MPLKPQAAKSKDKRTAISGVELQHRHFAFIASVISGLYADLGNMDHGRVIDRFADECAKSNPRFDRSRFKAACAPKSA